MSLGALRTLPRASVELPPLGFGAAPIGNLFTAVDELSAQESLACALRSGIRHIDTAPYYGYGLSERRVGRALRQLQPGCVILSTKVGRLIRAGEPDAAPRGDYAAAGSAVFDYSREGILRSFESSLERLGVERVDILLLHDVGAVTHAQRHAEMLQLALDQALPAMAQLKASGACRAIGIGVNEEAVCLEIMARFELDCILLAGRYSILDHSSLHGVMAQAQRRGVGIIVGGPYNSGLLAGVSGPGSTFDYRPVDAVLLRRARQLYALCERHGVDAGAVALQFPLAHPAVVSVIAGMRSPSEVTTALARMQAAIPVALWEALRADGFILPGAPTP